MGVGLPAGRLHGAVGQRTGLVVPSLERPHPRQHGQQEPLLVPGRRADALGHGVRRPGDHPLGVTQPLGQLALVLQRRGDPVLAELAGRRHRLGGQAAVGIVGVPATDQPSSSVLGERLQHREPCSTLPSADLHERLVDEALEDVGDLAPWHAVAGAHLLPRSVAAASALRR
jgi:hypothetical protein